MRHIPRSILFLVCLTSLSASFVGAQEKQSSDLFRIFVNGKYGFVDRTGKVVIEPQFESVDNFSEGLAPIYFYNSQSKEKSSTVFINDKGKFVINTISGSASIYKEGVSVIGFNVKAVMDGFTDGDFGLIDSTGKIIVEPKFGRITQFKEGLASAVLRNGYKYGFIDKTGNSIIPFQFDYANDFSEGLACVFNNEKYGFIDKAGKYIIKPEFTQAYSFSNGLAIVTTEEKSVAPFGTIIRKKGEKRTKIWKAIDKTGKVVFSIETEFINPFLDGLAAIYENGSYGFIDKTGKIVIKPQFSAASNFSEGLCKVFVRAEKGLQLAYIDKTGKIVIRQNFDNGGDFHNGLAEVYRGAYPNATSAYIDKDGKIIWRFPK